MFQRNDGRVAKVTWMGKIIVFLGVCGDLVGVNPTVEGEGVVVCFEEVINEKFWGGFREMGEVREGVIEVGLGGIV